MLSWHQINVKSRMSVFLLKLLVKVETSPFLQFHPCQFLLLPYFTESRNNAPPSLFQLNLSDREVADKRTTLLIETLLGS